MKVISLLFIVLSMNKAHATSTEDMMSVNVVLMDIATERINNLHPNYPCKDSPAAIPVISKLGEHEEKECDCKLNAVFGKIESQEIALDSGNDNFFHGAINLYSPSLRKYDGDDKGRTFNIGMNYSLIGSEGRLKIGIDSTGFGLYSKRDGSKYDPDGNHYLQFRELDTLDVKYDKFISKDDSKKVFGSLEFKLENETDNGKISRDIQDSWHHMVTYSNGSHPYYYHYVKDQEDLTAVKMLIGGGVDLEKTVAGITCSETLTGKVGASYKNSGTKMDYLYSARTETKLKASAIPYLVVSLWGEISRDFRGVGKEAGLELSFPMKYRSITIKPYIGVERHITPMDAAYGKDNGHPYEVYNTLGMKVQW
jgi:hypothetical protein